MKQGFKMFALSVLLFFAVSCSSTVQDMPEISETSSVKNTVVESETSFETVSISEDAAAYTSESIEASPIVMAIIYENYAWVDEQEIEIIDSSGSCYYFSNDQVQDYFGNKQRHDDYYIGFGFDENDWYNTLCDISKLGSVTELSDEELKTILDFSDKYETGLTKKYKEYESGLADYGSRYLYGIYNDNGISKYVLLCQYGNQIKCLDDENVIKFVNQMIDSGIFPAGHKDFQY